VLNGDGRAVGMVHEYDLLNALVANKAKFNDSIDSIVTPMQGAVSPNTSLNRLREIFAQDNVAVVKEGEKIVGIVTKIDLIDYLHRTGA
jgi:cystathionine beta-synthase